MIRERLHRIPHSRLGCVLNCILTNIGAQPRHRSRRPPQMRTHPPRYREARICLATVNPSSYCTVCNPYRANRSRTVGSSRKSHFSAAGHAFSRYRGVRDGETGDMSKSGDSAVAIQPSGRCRRTDLLGRAKWAVRHVSIQEVQRVRGGADLDSWTIFQDRKSVV